MNTASIPQKRTIRLYGEMGRKFGRVHHVHLDTNSTAEAVRYLCSQFPKFRSYMTTAHERGIGFTIFRGKENIGQTQLKDPVGRDDIRIAPMILGSKRSGIVNIIVGIVIIAAAIIYGIYTEDWVDAGNYIYLGAATALGGVIQLLTPIPKAAKGRDAPENMPSYTFAGAVNTQAQGNPVPLLYGRMIVGSAVISAGLNAEDYSPHRPGVGPGYPHFNPKFPGDTPP